MVVGSPNDEYRYVGTVGDNITKVFLDDVPDIDLSEIQRLDFGSYSVVTPTYKLEFDSKTTGDLDSTNTAGDLENELENLSVDLGYDLGVSITGTFADGFEVTFDGGDVVGCSVPRLKVISTDLPSAIVTKTGPRTLTEQNSAFTYKFQRAADYIYRTKPAHIHVSELRVGGFRASISRAGETV